MSFNIHVLQQGLQLSFSYQRQQNDVEPELELSPNV